MKNDSSSLRMFLEELKNEEISGISNTYNPSSYKERNYEE